MSAKVLQTLGQRIVAARHAYTPERMSQRALAKRIGISTKSLNLIESGDTTDPRSSIVRHISEVLGVSTDWLLKGDGRETDSAGEHQAWREKEPPQPPDATRQAPTRPTKRSRTPAKVAEQ
jgi:transcriptional regulator with XRE-family HTH domain